MPRFRIDPRDIPVDKVARRLHLTQARFDELLPALHDRGSPRPDPTTGMYDLHAIERWMDDTVRLTGKRKLDQC